MVFTFEDYRTLVQMLYEHPEWREELRPLVLSEELLKLPETQARTEAILDRIAARLDAIETSTSQRFDAVDERFDAVDKRFAGVDERFDAVDKRFAGVDERFDAVDERFDTVDQRFVAVDGRLDAVDERLGGIQEELGGLREDVGGLQEDMGGVKQRLTRVDNRLSRTDGHWLELSYRTNIGPIFGKWLRRPTAISPYDLPGVEMALASGELSENEMEQLRALDLLVQGGDKNNPGTSELLLAVEISVTIDANDVRRAAERAALLRRAGYAAQALVGGERVTQGAARLGEQEDVLIDLRAVVA